MTQPGAEQHGHAASPAIEFGRLPEVLGRELVQATLGGPIPEELAQRLDDVSYAGRAFLGCLGLEGGSWQEGVRSSVAYDALVADGREEMQEGGNYGDSSFWQRLLDHHIGEALVALLTPKDKNPEHLRRIGRIAQIRVPQTDRLSPVLYYIRNHWLAAYREASDASRPAILQTIGMRVREDLATFFVLTGNVTDAWSRDPAVAYPIQPATRDEYVATILTTPNEGLDSSGHPNEVLGGYGRYDVGTISYPGPGENDAMRIHRLWQIDSLSRIYEGLAYKINNVPGAENSAP